LAKNLLIKEGSYASEKEKEKSSKEKTSKEKESSKEKINP